MTTSSGDPEAAVHFPFPHEEWNVTPLTFAPTAINDSGLIVGEQNGQAVQYQNGTVQPLPLDVAPGGVSAAVDVTSLGAILGKTSDQQAPAVLWWPLTLKIPQAPVGMFVPAAMNKNLGIVGSSLDAKAAFKWTPATAYEPLFGSSGSNNPTFATDVNDHGYIVGFTEAPGDGTPILWTPPNNVPSAPWRGASTRSDPHINNSGDVALIDGGQNVSILSLNGTIRSFPAIPDPRSVDGISDEGRLIGTSIVNGARRGWTFLDVPMRRIARVEASSIAR
jgi:hypothetical protein